MNRKHRILSTLFCALAIITLNAHAEYYAVYPVSMVDNNCGSCDSEPQQRVYTERHYQRHYYHHPHYHHHHHKIHHYAAHRHSTMHMEVYYTEHPCGGCATPCLPYFNGIPESQIPYHQTSYQNDEEQYYDQTGNYQDEDEVDNSFYNDRATADDDLPDMQMGND